LANFSDSNVEYLIRYDADGHQLQVDLQDLTFEWLRDDEEPDAFECSGLQPAQPEAPLLLLSPEATALKRQRTEPLAAKDAANQTEATLLSDVLISRGDPVSRLVGDVIESLLARARDSAAQEADDLPIMRPLRSIEWFAGSARLSFALRRNHGWGHAVIHDYDPSKVEWQEHGMQPDTTTFRSDEFLDEVRLGAFYQEAAYDYFHFSVDCSSFSGLGHAGQGRNESNDFLGNGAACARGNRMIHKACDLIGIQMERNPHFLFTLENPFTGRMKDHPIVHARLEAPREHGGLGAQRVVVDYCWFFASTHAERAFRKRTIFWTNSPTMIREFGVHAPPARSSHYICERRTPCQCYGAHRAVNSSTTREATPFPRLLAESIARCVTLDAAKQRWRRAF
jgi:hypothetical protein